MNRLLLCIFRVPTTMSTQAPTFTQPLQNVVSLEGSAATFQAQVSGEYSTRLAQCCCFQIYMEGSLIFIALLAAKVFKSF